MQSFENTITIERPVEEVFAFLADFENVPTWNYAIEETRKTSPQWDAIMLPSVDALIEAMRTELGIGR